MADKDTKKEKKIESKIVLEREYTVPLRRYWLRVPKYRRAEKSVFGLKEFMAQHMKTAEKHVRVDVQVNQDMWHHGMRNPLTRITVKATKDAEGIVRVLPMKSVPAKVPQIVQRARDKAVAGKKKDAVKKDVKADQAETKAEHAHEEKAATAKKVQKEELQEMQKENLQHKTPAKPSVQPANIPAHPSAPKRV